MNRRRTAANPYLPAETNPFGQQENPFVPMNETIEQGIAPTEPEGPRVVTGPDTPQTAKPRGEVVTVDASLDRMKVAVMCEACGQRGLLRLGQVSDSTRCRCGSARVELLEASRKSAMPVMRTSVPSEYLVTCPGVGLEPTEKLYSHYDKARRYFEEERVAACPACNHKIKVKRDGTVGSHQITEATFSSAYNKVKHLLNWESSLRTAVNDFDWNDESGDLVKYVQVSGDTELELVVSPEAPFKWFLWTNSPSGSDMLEAGRADDTESAKRAAETAAEFWAITVSSSRKRRTASEGWSQSLNPHHFFKTVSAGDHTLNLFVSDVDYRWTVDAMVTGNSSSLELFEQGIGTSLEDAKRQAEQSAKFF